MFDLLIKGGQVVTPHGVGDYDIAVEGERIVGVAVPGTLPQEAKRVIDAKGKVVVPGGIEPHAHVQNPRMNSQKTTGASRACAFGGTTTIVDFAESGPSADPLTAVAEKKKEWSGNSYIDYTFHCTLLSEPPVEHLQQIPEVIAQGLTSIKCYTRGRPPLRVPPSQMEDGYLHEIMTIVARHGGIVAVHAENEAMLNFTREKLKREGRIGYENLHLVHSNLSEDIEFRKVIRLAEHAGAALYMVHTSAKEGARAIGEARARGLPVYGETIMNYMSFTIENYKEPDGVKYQNYPSVKYPEDRETMWAAILDGRLSTVATDDVTTSYEAKIKGRTLFDAMGGSNGVEVRMGYVFSEGVSKRKMSLQRFVDVTSANIAKILGMYPKKGTIAPGSDADIAIIDPKIRKKLTAKDLHADSDYTNWEGWEFRGWPIITILRGKVIVENGKLLGSLSDGKFVARKIASEIVKGPAC